jgi:hypothetical protein
MRIVYEGRPESLHALARLLADEGVIVHLPTPTDLQDAGLRVEIRAYGDDGSDDGSDALRAAVTWVIANFEDERPWATVRIADDGM